jgi:hypothetical protein
LGDATLRKPMTGIAGCCARDASGHAAALLTTLMKSRRFIAAQQVRDKARHRIELN